MSVMFKKTARLMTEKRGNARIKVTCTNKFSLVYI